MLNGTRPVLPKASIIMGIIISCKIMPGIAVVKAPDKNIAQVNFEPDTPERINLATAQTTLPPSIAQISEQ